MEHQEALYSYRCSCGRLLFKGFLLDSTVQIKCRKCSRLMSFQGLNERGLSESKFGMMFDQRGNVVSASSNIQNLFGYSLSDLLMKNYGDLLHAGKRELAKAGFAHLWSLQSKEKYFYHSKVTFSSQDGRSIPGSIQSKFVTKDERTLLFSVFRSGRAACEQKEKEFSLLEAYPFILHVDRDGLCVDDRFSVQNSSEVPRTATPRTLASFMNNGQLEQRHILERLASNAPFSLADQPVVWQTGKGMRMNMFFNPNFDSSGECVDYTVFATSR